MSETPYAHPGGALAALNFHKDAINAVHLVKDYKQSEDRATNLAKSIANDAITPGDMAIIDESGDKILVINAKSGLTKTADSKQHHAGTATSGTTASLTQTGAVFTGMEGKVVHVTEGTNNGKSAKITTVAGDTVNFAAGAFPGAIDATSKFVILDDLSAVYVSDTDIHLAFEEKTDKAIEAASGDAVNVSQAKYRLKVTENEVA